MSRRDAFEVFETKDVDTSRADFSDSITSGPLNSYRVQTIPETLDSRIARLKREVEEVQILTAKKDSPTASPQKEMGELKEILNALPRYNSRGELTFYDGLGEKQAATDSAKTQLELTNRLLERYLNRFTDLETRLTALETQIGVSATRDAKPILPNLNELRQRINLISNTPSGIEKAVSNLKDMAVAVEKLKTVRQQQPPRSISASQEGDHNKHGNNEDSTLEVEYRKIEAIYDRLPVLDNLSAAVPYLISRLKSLQGIHADAAASTETLRNIDSTVETINYDFKQWQESLKMIENKITDMSTKMQENRDQIQEWVRDMENRISQLPE